jgi:hypothetical protein
MLANDRKAALRAAAVKAGVVGAIAMTLAACGGAQTTVVEPAQPIKTTAIMVQEMRSSVSIPSELMAELRDKLTAKLYKPGGFGKGNGLKLAYRVVEYDGGTGASRWSYNAMTGSAEGSLVIEAVYLDKSGKEVGRVRAEGKVGSSLLGHSMDDAVDHVTDELAQYTNDTFRVAAAK